MKGVTTIDKFDGQLTIGSVAGIKKIPDFRSSRVDTSPESVWASLSYQNERYGQGYRCERSGKAGICLGTAGIGYYRPRRCQSFPDANHALDDIDDKFRDAYAKEHPDTPKDVLKSMHAPFKVIYGTEAYLVDDLQDLVLNSKNQSLDGTFVVFDLETTGFSPIHNRIIEIGAVKVENGAITEKFSTFVNPEVPIPYKIEELTSINDNMVLDAPVIEKILPEFLKFCV